MTAGVARRARANEASGGGGVRSALSRIWCAALDLLFPRRCASCSGALPVPDGAQLCERCVRNITFAAPEQCCRRCGLPLGPFALDHEGRYCEGCAHLPLVGFRHTVAVGTYEGPLRRAICRYKYSGRPHLARTLGSFLADRVHEEYADDPPDLVLAVPLHRARVKERTFDQALLLARAVAKALGAPLATGLLVRACDTPTLAHQARQQRVETVRDAFALTSPRAVRGRRILLVDDVMTTGATASECARVLKAAGAEEIVVAVLARTP